MLEEIKYEYRRSLREQWKRYAFVMYDSIEMVLFIIGFIIFYSYLGYRLFKGSLEGEAYFSTIGDSIFNLLVLLTTANFPDVMLPAYKVSRWYSVFFISFLIFGLFLFLNMLLAIFYNNYKARLDAQLNLFVDKRVNFIHEKFEECDRTQTGRLNKEETKQLLVQLFSFE